MRDIRIDLLRGYAMLTISINHLSNLFVEIGLNGRPVPTLTTYGFSSAAELFFLLSGYMIGIVYVGKPNFRQKVWRRAGKIYRYNVGAFIFALSIAWWFGAPVSVATSSEPFLEQPTIWIPRFFLLLGHPDLLGVLSTYVLLMLATPLVVLAARRSLPIIIFASCALYICTQLFPTLNLPGGTPGKNGLWNLNPFSWQLLFFAGILAGSQGVLQSIFAWLTVSRRRQAVILLALFLFVILHSTLKPLIPNILIRKDNLGLIRILHAGLVVAALCSAILLLERFHMTLPGRLIALTGRQTLNCFTATIPITYLMAANWVLYGREYYGYLASVLIMLFLVVFVAWTSEFRFVRRSRLVEARD